MKQKTITRKFKQIISRRAYPSFDGTGYFEDKERKPSREEILNWLMIQSSRGYCLLKGSITVRNTSPERNVWSFWGWFFYIGKRRVQEMAMYDKKTNEFIPLYQLKGTFSNDSLSEEAKEVISL